MDCASATSFISSTGKSNSVAVDSAPCHEKAQQFSKMLEQPSGATDIFVSNQSGSIGHNPFTHIMSQFNSIDMTPKTGAHSGSSSGGNANEQAQSMGDSVIAVQSEMLRTMMMMEVMSTTKQGVTTLFQQQG